MLKIIQNNPYRFMGVCANAPTTERLANIRKINAFLKVNKEISFPLDLPTLIPSLVRTPEGLNTATSSINLSKDQLKYALFWFINSSDIDNIALDYLKSGNSLKASELFGKKETYSSLINSGILAFINDDNGQAIKCITKVIHEDNYREALVESICGSNFQIDESAVSHLFIETLLDEFDIRDLIKLFSEYSYSFADDDFLREKYIGEIINRINSAIDQAKSVERNDASAQYHAGVALMNTTKSDLKELRSLFDVNDMQYQLVADNLAKQILQCGINYYNNAEEVEEEDVKINKAYKLQSYALNIAVGKLTKDRCQDNVNILNKKKKELPPKEVRYYYNFIKNALDSYINKPTRIQYAIDLIKETVPYLMSIKEVLGRNNAYYLSTSTMIVNASLHNVITEFNGVMQIINKSLHNNKAAALLLIMDVFNKAWDATLYMDQLDMESDFRYNRYNPNRNSLKSQVESIINIYQSVSLDMRGETQIFNECKTISDLNNYTRLFPNGKYSQQVKEKLEKLEYDACKTIQDCENFQKKYPHTRYSIEDKKEDCCYKQCKTVAQFKDYLIEYPYGKYVSQAKEKIDKLSFDNCKNVADYKRYMSNFPRGKYYAEAKLFVEDEEMWSKCVSTDSKELYKEYLAKYPQGHHKAEAEKKASACYIATMVYGDYNDPQVIVLRDFRDNILQNSPIGRIFIRYYYKHSPYWVDKMQDKMALNAMIRTMLNLFIKLYKYERK